ncbi:unnamed protein product [Mytilus coruscus]|uniref:C2H2-type domain-containing protein n=1 Tax=Mytilus coruscus TaxID=42192 RepID=A0A6J8CP00_MYTCO|nr:unnamed protein product [Mytilus coruscus]
MENTQNIALTPVTNPSPGQVTNYNVKPYHMQPVQTSGGRDLASDLVWQRDPDCSRDPNVGNHGNPMMVSQGVHVPGNQTQMMPVNQPHGVHQMQGVTMNQPQTVPVNQSPSGYPVPNVSNALPHNPAGYQYQGQTTSVPTALGDHAHVSMAQTFQMPQGNVYPGMRPQGVVNYLPVTSHQQLMMDTDGNRIQQNTMMQQNMAMTGFQMPQNMVPVQYNPNFVQGGNMNGNTQYMNMRPPTTTVQHQPQQANYNYPRLVPYNQQLMNAPRTQYNNPRPPVVPKPTLNIMAANQVAQKPTDLNISAGTQVSSPDMGYPTVQSPTVASPGTESVKSPTYVFMCNKCNYVTPHRSSFKTHYSSHIQYKPYQCAYCDHATIMKQPMQKHVKMKHAIEDSEGFTYESDSKKENIIEFFSNQCRSTMNLEEAKKYLDKYESGEKLKSGPAKRKLSMDERDKDSSKRKRSWPEAGDDSNQSDALLGPSRSSISPRKLTHWKQGVTFEHHNQETKTKVGRGRSKTFSGFAKQKKFITSSVMKCPFCEFKSGSRKGLKRHCNWRHLEKRYRCNNCIFSTFFLEEMEVHIQSDHCESYQLHSHERSKSPEKTVGRPRKNVSSAEETTPKTVTIDRFSEENADESGNDDMQLNCPHCNFSSNPFALKRHLFFYHKECDWKCKICGFISDSKKELVRHSNKAHPNTQPNIVQTFADISSLLPDNASEQEKGTPPDKDIDENEKVVSKHKLIDRDYIKTSKKRLVLGKKRVSKTMNDSSGEDKLQIMKMLNERKGQKRGRKREEKKNDQNSYVVRPKKLKIARIGFSCVYCTYAAPLRHQLRLHCYEKHTKHPACLMEFINSTMALEEQEDYARDKTEEKKSPEKTGSTMEINTEINVSGDMVENSSGNKQEDLEEKPVQEDEQDSIEKLEGKKIQLMAVAESFEEKKNKLEESVIEISSSDETKLNITIEDSDCGEKEKTEGETTKYLKDKGKNEIEHLPENPNTRTDTSISKVDEDQNKEVLTCMENILANIGNAENTTTNNGANDYILQTDKFNGHKFSNPFSTLIVQLNSTQLLVKDAFEGTLDDVDIYLEKYGVRTLNMDSLTPRQFSLFMKKFGSNLQQIAA